MDLIFNKNTCSQVSITTPTSSKEYLKYINGTIIKPSYNIRKYTVTSSLNCCSSSVYDVPVNYQFNVSSITCQAVINQQHEYTINLIGINSLFIQSLKLSYNNVNFVSTLYTSISNGFSYKLYYNNSDVSIISAIFPNPQNTEDYTHYLELTTVDNFIYKIEVRFTLTEPGLCNITAFSVINVIRPIFDEHIYIYSNSVTTPLIPNSLSLNQLQYGNNVDPLIIPNNEALNTGVYNVIICEVFLSNPLLVSSLSSNCVQNSYWLDCGIYCDLINKLVSCKDSDIFNYYDALNYSNDCDTAYEDKCALYELMINKLNSPGCYDPYDDCNCNDSTDSFFKNRVANGTNNNKVNSRPCGCS